jgi:Tfp pilus assembly protein PilN
VRAVNLLPSEAQRRARSVTPNQVALAGAIAGVVCVAAIGGGNLFQSSRAASAQKTLNAAKLQLAATPLPPAIPQVTPPPAVVAAQMAPRLQAVSAALSTRIAWDRVLREFSLVLPSDIQLTQLNLSQPIPGATASTGLQLDGVTYSYDSVARLLARMALIPDLTNVTLGSTSVAKRIVSFTVSAAVKGSVAPVVAPVLPTTTTDGAPS